MPYDVPSFLPPYVYGLVFALSAMTGSARGVKLAYIALRVLGGLIILGSVVVIVIEPALGLAELIVGTLLALPTGGSKEARVAVNGIEVAVVCLLWFGFWSMMGDALVGVYLSLVSSIGLLVGCVAWSRELATRPVIEMPRAVAVGRHRE
jgi:hypothetical protein